MLGLRGLLMGLALTSLGPGLASPAVAVEHETHILFTGIATVNRPGGAAVTEIALPRVFKHFASQVTGESIPNHVSFVVVDLNALNVINGPTAYSDHQSKFVAGNFRLYILAPGNLHVDGLTSGPGASAVDQVDADCNHPTAGNLYYIPHLTALLPGGVCSADLPQNVVTYAVHSGNVGAYKLSGDIEDFIGTDGRSYQKQRIAQVVDWKFTRPADRLVIKDARNADVLVVEPKDPTLPIAIVTGGAELADIRRVLDGLGGGPQDHDHHFDVYYDRCQDVPDRPIPYDTEMACAGDASYQNFRWWPNWMKDGNRTLVVGGFNCGPDQFP